MGIAKYKPQPIDEWQGNPFIEALPPLMNDEDVYTALTKLPKYDANVRSNPKEVRLHELLKLLQIFVPLPRHQRIALNISRMIRGGYASRNPTQIGYWNQIRGRVEMLDLSAPDNDEIQRDTSASLGASLIGVSGIGKTTCVRDILRTYSQVIEHGIYQTIPINIRQVVYLRLETPQGGSIKGLCMNFFAELDKILKTNYVVSYGRGTVDIMMLAMAHLAAIHAIGILVIDEIQELSNVRSVNTKDTDATYNGAGRMLGFFLQLTNTIGVPILLIGTYRSSLVLNAQLRHRRRLNGLGLPEWKPIAWGAEFDAVLEVIWGYQYTREVTELTNELKKRLYHESQGITDFVIKIFMLSQDRLISVGHDNRQMTPALISTVAKACLHNAQPILNALRQGNQRLLEKLDDIPKQSFEELLGQLEAARTTHPDYVEPIDNDRAASGAEPSTVGVEPVSSEQVEKPKPKTSKRPVKKVPHFDVSHLPCVLKDLVSTERAHAEPGRAALKAAGYVKIPREFEPAAS